MKKLIIAATLTAAFFGSTAQAQTDNIFALEVNTGDSGWSAGQYFLHQKACMHELVKNLNFDDWKPEQLRCVEVEMN